MKRYLFLPKQYDLIVGDTFELFYRGIVNFLSIEGYDFELFYEDGKNRGKGFSRKYLFTPTIDDLGVHDLHIRLWNNEGDILEEQVVKINVVEKRLIKNDTLCLSNTLYMLMQDKRI